MGKDLLTAYPMQQVIKKRRAGISPLPQDDG